MKIPKVFPTLGATLGLILAFVRADNHFVQTLYSTDPAPMVHNGSIYVFTGHDKNGATTYNMRDRRLYSSKDLANWQDHGVVADMATFSWANANTWAPRARNTGSMAIGVAVADSITGPYKDALGKPLVENNEIDPTVFIDDDGQAYLY
ncbi:uncharacterized protein PgNI_02673 [Pyricularia grisea]|uniref:Uncharacterized protein n=1 Tax=Pyricularia grisea TaxID=148305 RepID=A0A6P8BEJ2_PYRGI|nr:uncharacterized protein PgNI_02673 [Pyricularia grisea]TLD14117.1 hypothetical protein PgNI_02673 [Pyricularia grisea]